MWFEVSWCVVVVFGLVVVLLWVVVCGWWLRFVVACSCSWWLWFLVGGCIIWWFLVCVVRFVVGAHRQSFH